MHPKAFGVTGITTTISIVSASLVSNSHLQHWPSKSYVTGCISFLRLPGTQETGIKKLKREMMTRTRVGK